MRFHQVLNSETNKQTIVYLLVIDINEIVSRKIKTDFT
jgi:hypothetical protein